MKIADRLKNMPNLYEMFYFSIRIFLLSLYSSLPNWVARFTQWLSKLLGLEKHHRSYIQQDYQC